MIAGMFAGPGPGEAQDSAALVGTWAGALEVPGGAGTLRIVFHLAEGDAGSLDATMDSPDQGAFGIAASPVTVADGSIRIEVSMVKGHYEGTIAEGGQQIDGTWHQGGVSMPLVLEPSAEAGPSRPQEPEEPYPYEETDVSFESAADGVTLAGTLTIPPGNGPYPAVVLVSGSGPQDRDETVFGHKPFLVLADYLTRKGIAVLRYDDRGVGESTGDFGTAVTPDFADDAEGAVRYLATQPTIDREKIGIIGHSEGAIVAPIVANRSDDVAFVILLAGTGVNGEELLVMQLIAINRAMGVSEEVTQQRSALQRELLGLLSGAPDDSTTAEQAREILAGAGVTGQTADAQIAGLLNPWMSYFLLYDPIPELGELQVPVLAMWGEKDMQVPPEGNREPVEQALAESGNPDVTVSVLPGLNHLFQTSDTGAPTEYATIEETMSPASMEMIAEWIEARVR
jgi:pimeloyl-ACP methyl ester carboxylesterase